MIKAVCIDDSGKPAEIPQDKWIKKDETYNIIKITIHPKQKSIQGCEIAEITLDESCDPYEYFKLSRFAISQDDISALIELAKMSSDISGIDVTKLLQAEEIGLLN